jgi:hypothetical protein
MKSSDSTREFATSTRESNKRQKLRQDSPEMGQLISPRIVYETRTQSYSRRYDDTEKETFWKVFMEHHVRLHLLPVTKKEALTDDSVIIGGNEETLITIKKLGFYIPGEFIAVIDSAQPNRAFFGHTFH